ncbi:MAG: choice-of-anchor D domain-containing protein, partial [Gammaproteobacteria bacterium]
SCTLTVHFAPTTTSAFIDSFDIPSDDPDEPSVTVNVSSTGDTTVPDILVTDGFDPATDLQLTFLTTTMGGTANGSIAIYNNSGTANLLIGTIGGVNGLSAPFSIQNDGCSNQSLVPHGICTVSLQFAPTTAGTFNDSFDIPSNDPDESTVTFNVSGTSNP